MSTIGASHAGRCGQGQIAAVTAVWPDFDSTNTNKTKALSEYLKTNAGLPFELGKTDCACLAASWVKAKRGFDPLAGIRGYCASGDALDWRPIARHVARAMRAAGVHLTLTPAARDVGIILVSGAVAGAVRGGRFWIVHDPAGLAMVPLDRVRVIVAWSLSE